MMHMEQVFKPIDLGGLAPFAKGGTGECYRLNEDTILKLYYEGFPVESVLREKDGARIALTAGVPTAISFNLVRSGQRLGVLYEFIQGQTFSEIAAQSPERAEELGEMLSGIAYTLHHAEVKRQDLPASTALIRQVIPGIDYAPAETVQHILQFLDTLDREHCYVHGDFHPNNVIITKDGPMLIDMGGFSVGCPFFDLATLHFNLFDSPEALKGGRSSFNGLTREDALNLWRGFEKAYFSGAIGPKASALLYKVTLLKKLWFERRFGVHFPEEYGASIRDEVNIVFKDEGSTV